MQIFVFKGFGQKGKRQSQKTKHKLLFSLLLLSLFANTPSPMLWLFVIITWSHLVSLHTKMCTQSTVATHTFSAIKSINLLIFFVLFMLNLKSMRKLSSSSSSFPSYYLPLHMHLCVCVCVCEWSTNHYFYEILLTCLRNQIWKVHVKPILYYHNQNYSAGFQPTFHELVCVCVCTFTFVDH